MLNDEKNEGPMTTTLKLMKDESEKCAKHLLSENNTNRIALWGAGNRCKEYFKIFIEYGLNICFIVDKNTEIQGSFINGVPCINDIKLFENKDIIVIITIDSTQAQLDISDICRKNGFQFCIYKDILERIIPQIEAAKIYRIKFEDAQICKDVIKMQRYIGINLPTYGCNLECTYCYLNKKNGSEAFPKLWHISKYIRFCLRKKKIGTAFIGICAYGETLLSDKITELCTDLLHEGHYLHIVTNGTYTSKIKDIISKAEEFEGHLMFKMSFHYLELKKKNLLGKFVESINVIKDSHASFTIELVPSDDLIPLIPEILKFSMKNFGAYPQLTIGRDESNDMKLLTKLSNEEYFSVWSCFDSEMFELRKKTIYDTWDGL